MKPVTAVLYTCFYYLQKDKEKEHKTEAEAWKIKHLEEVAEIRKDFTLWFNEQSCRGQTWASMNAAQKAGLKTAVDSSQEKRHSGIM